MQQPPEGMAYRWVVTHVKGESVDTRSLDDAIAGGWLRVPPTRYPEDTGCVLLERPKVEADAGLNELADLAIRQFVLSNRGPVHYTFTDGTPACWIVGDEPEEPDTLHILTHRGWFPVAEYRAQERPDGSNPLDEEG